MQRYDRKKLNFGLWQVGFLLVKTKMGSTFVLFPLPSFGVSVPLLKTREVFFSSLECSTLSNNKRGWGSFMVKGKWGGRDRIVRGMGEGTTSV